MKTTKENIIHFSMAFHRYSEKKSAYKQVTDWIISDIYIYYYEQLSPQARMHFVLLFVYEIGLSWTPCLVFISCGQPKTTPRYLSHFPI